MADFKSSFSEYDNSVEKSKLEIPGILGLPLSGSKIVNILSRPGYVYVRLRENLSEVVQAYNDTVSPVYDLPVVVQRLGRRWVVTGRDLQRYENWGTSYAYLPQHGFTHSFDKRGNGGDTVFIYPDQFMPLLVYPSGTNGAKGAVIGEYLLQKTNGGFQYVGNVGTSDLTIYKPTIGQAIMGLLYLDNSTGGYGVLVNSGTPMTASFTGSSDVAPYIPAITGAYTPLYAFRLVSGTSTIGWDNLYNVRQFFGAGSNGGGSGGGIPDAPADGLTYGRNNNVWVNATGTGGGGTLPSLSPKDVVYINSSGSYSTTGSFQFDESPLSLSLNSDASQQIPILPIASFRSYKVSGSFGGSFWDFGAGAPPGFFGVRLNGDVGNVLGIVQNDIINEFNAIGYGPTWSGMQFQASGTVSPSQYYKGKAFFDAPADWTTGSWPTSFAIKTTPSGTVNPIETLRVSPEGTLNIPKEQNYNRGGNNLRPYTRILANDLILLDGMCMTLMDYLNAGIYNIDLEGDSVLMIL